MATGSQFGAFIPTTDVFDLPTNTCDVFGTTAPVSFVAGYLVC